MAKKQKTEPYLKLYTSDFMMGSALMTDAEVGKYIRLLCYQHQYGHLSTEDFNLIIKGNFPRVKAKFVQDSEGKWYNERLESEIKDRVKYSSDQSNRAKTRWAKENVCENDASASAVASAVEYAELMPRDEYEHILDTIILEDTKSPKPQTRESNTQTQNLEKVKKKDSPDPGQADRTGLGSLYTDLYES